MRKTKGQQPLEVGRYEEAAALLCAGFGLQGTEMRGERIGLLFPPEAAEALSRFRAGQLCVDAQAFSSNLQMMRKVIFAARREGGID